MQTYGNPPRPVPGPAVTAGAEHHPALAPVDGWVLNDMRERAERQAKSIHARSEWLAARRHELWARMDQLRDEIGPRAPFVPASPLSGRSAAIGQDLESASTRWSES